MVPRNTTPISELKKERKRLIAVIETFLLATKLSGKPLHKESWCVKAGLSKCYLSSVLTDKTFKRRISKNAAIKLSKVVCKRGIKISKEDFRPDLFCFEDLGLSYE